MKVSIFSEPWPPRWRKIKNGGRTVEIFVANEVRIYIANEGGAIDSWIEEPWVLVPTRYDIWSFGTDQWALPGFWQKLANWPTAKEMSWRVKNAAYVRQPMASLYGMVCMAMISSGVEGDIEEWRRVFWSTGRRVTIGHMEALNDVLRLRQE